MKTIWFDAQLKTPKGSQLCVVIGKTKTPNQYSLMLLFMMNALMNFKV